MNYNLLDLIPNLDYNHQIEYIIILNTDQQEHLSEQKNLDSINNIKKQKMMRNHSLLNFRHSLPEPSFLAYLDQLEISSENFGFINIFLSGTDSI